MDGQLEDSSESDAVVSSSRRSRSTTVRADLDGALDQAYRRASADYDEEKDNEDIDSETEREDDDQEDKDHSDAWWVFSQQLRGFETDTKIRKLYPPSLHTDWRPPLEPCDEQELLRQLISAEADSSAIPSPENGVGSNKEQEQGLPEFQEFIVRDFVVYGSVENKDLPGHMQSLHVVATEQKTQDFYFDGYLDQDGTRRYLHRILIRDVSIGSLQDRSRHSAEDQIYIQSKGGYGVGRTLNEDIWYRLEQPTIGYSSLFTDFLWVADLVKHFLDYMTIKADIDQDVHLEDFRAKFIDQLRAWHSNDAMFRSWHEKCSSKLDFRQHIARHAKFLNNQTWSLEKRPGTRLLRQPIWWQICPGHDFSSSEGPQNPEERTVVTHNVKKSFCVTFPAWGPEGFNLLNVVNPVVQVETSRRRRMRELRFPDKFRDASRYHTADNIALTAETLENVGCAKSRPKVDPQEVVGNVVIIRRDELDEIDPKFRCSFAFVRGTLTHRRKDALSVVWLLHPQETICGHGFYPHGNELFFSDECNCQPVPLSDLMAVYGISVFSDHADTNATFFAREKYFMDEQCFRTAKASDLECSCRTDVPAEQSHSQRMSAKPSLGKSQMKGSDETPVSRAFAALVPNGTVRPILRSLSLFTGSGNLDRGLEDSNIIKTTYAIDCNKYGMQTSMANQKEKGEHRTESVNYCLRRLLRGREKLPGIDCIVSGSPCPGFSGLNNHKAGKNAQRNCTLLASTMSYVELFLPHYVLIENVPGMDFGSPNACEQAICSLVGLGYQVRKCLLRACEFGAAQTRMRLFLLAASPGLPLPRDPLELAIDEPFPTVSDAIKGLPEIDNDTIINIVKPDHIPLKRLQPEFGVVNLRSLVQKIPTSPPAMNLYKTNQLGLLSHTEIEWYLSQSDERRRKGSKSLGRVDPNRPFPTVVTTINEMCSRSGAVVHPFEDRLMSLEEYKIAQGYLEDDVLIGPLNQQFKQVGNAVARPVAVVLGLVMAESWCAANEAGIVPQSTRSSDQSREDLQDGDEDVESTTDKMSILAIEDTKASDTTLIKEGENSPEPAQPGLHTSVTAIANSDSNSESPSQTSRERSRLLSAFSARGSPDIQLRTELHATIPGHRLSPDKGPSRRGKRIRYILDSDDDNTLEEDQLANRRHAGQRQKDGRRASKSARTTSDTVVTSSNTAEDPIVLSD
jgi:site-specific DNA-cytosine methylase